MKNVLHVLGRDLLRLLKAPAALVVVVVVCPSSDTAMCALICSILSGIKVI